MFFFVLYIGIAVACGVIASSKGRSGFGWFLLGLLFPLIALIIIACLPNLNPAPQQRMRAANGVKYERCWKCREIISSHDNFCPSCGASQRVLSLQENQVIKNWKAEGGKRKKRLTKETSVSKGDSKNGNPKKKPKSDNSNVSTRQKPTRKKVSSKKSQSNEERPKKKSAKG